MKGAHKNLVRLPLKKVLLWQQRASILGRFGEMHGKAEVEDLPAGN